jgi:predicted MFS family arabinose efflux permease
MSALPTLLTDVTVLAAATGLSYSVTLLGVALVSVVSRAPARRRDARATLMILVRRQPRG